MDPYQRGRSPSHGNGSNNNIRKSPSPRPDYMSHNNNNTAGQSIDPSLQAFANHPANLAPDHSYRQSFDPSAHYSTNDFPNGQHYSLNTFSQPSTQSQNSSQYTGYQDQASGGSLDFDSFNPQNSFHDPSSLDTSFQSTHLNDNSFDSSQPFDDSAFLDLDPNLQDLQNFGPNTALSEDMSTLQYKTPEAPHLLQPEMQQTSHGSPTVFHDAQTSIQHSRNTSLDPAAAYAHGSEWTAFRGHRRTASDQHSDISSNNASPLLGNDGFEPQDSSPMLNGSGDPSVFGPVALGLSHFSLTDTHNPSPGHSTQHSPYLGAQQGQQMFPPQDDFTLMNNEAQYSAFQGQEVFPSTEYMQQNSHDPGQADQMQPPQITFDPAPPSKQNSTLNLESMGTGDPQVDSLSPPLHSGRLNRQRAVSDPYSSGPSSYDAASGARPRTPSLSLHPIDSLSAHSRSRSQSPGPNNGIQKHYRRSSSPAVPSPTSRERMVEMGMAAQSSPQPSDNGSAAGSPGSTSETSPAPNANSKNSRSKHPANYQCTLCPKRFTRAYNLRSHLRTHTDERPFVCTVCGKAFARQHDRKRHEGLHSGEKKFVCRGNLTDAAGQNNGHWGCGRRFARADALGRHFRSEAGRACIKPLLDEEARQRQDYAMEQRQMMAAQSHLSQPVAMAPNMPNPMVDLGNMPLPAALLAQYPALAGIDFSAPMMNGSEYDGGDNYENYDHSEFEDGPDFGGRSSFDASSGGEETGYFSGQEVDNGGYGVQQQGLPQGHGHGHGQGWG